MSSVAGSMVEQEARRSARSLFSPGRVAAEKITADVTDKMVVRENVHFAGETFCASLATWDDIKKVGQRVIVQLTGSDGVV